MTLKIFVSIGVFLLLASYLSITTFSLQQEASNVRLVYYQDNYDFDGTYVTDHNGLEYNTNTDGSITLKKNAQNIGSFYFAITGTSNGTRQKYSSTDFEWNWRIEHKQDNNDYILTGVSNSESIGWIQEYHFFGDDRRPMKITHRITNKLKNPLSNIMFWYVNELNSEISVRFEGQKVTDEGTVWLEKNIDEISDFEVHFDSDYFFEYKDMVQGSVDFYVGESALAKRAGDKVAAIGVERDSLPSGETMVIDPSIGSCQTLGESNVVYELTQNISNQGSNCFSITGNFTTFDLKGYTLDGIDFAANGILAFIGKNVTIRGGVIKEFATGIRTGENGTVYNMTLLNITTGINLPGNQRTTVIGNRIEASQYGINMHDNEKYGRIISNTINHTGTGSNFAGIRVHDTQNSLITLNNITSVQYAVYIDEETQNNSFTFNNLNGTTRDVYVYGISGGGLLTTNNTISNNTLGGGGIFLAQWTLNNRGSRNCGGTITDQGNNNVTDDGCGLDLAVTDIIPIQVVQGVDMVLGKTGLARVVVENSGGEGAIAVVNITLSGYRLAAWNNSMEFTITKPISGEGSEHFDFRFKPNSTGTQMFSASVTVS